MQDLGVDIIEQDIADLDMSLFEMLISDKTTGKYILWGTDVYAHLGERYAPDQQILPELILGSRTRIIQPRVSKSAAEQQERTRKKAEVFTPSWVVNMMNNYCDAVWFGRDGIFNKEDGEHWIVNEEPVPFEKKDGWKKYVDSRRLEITCGEAPYLVSRYDAATGEMIPTKERIGILDRKLRVVGENTADEKEWLKWAYRALEATYGYEFQGDNLLIARVNVLATFIDYMVEEFGKRPTVKQLNKAANIICWNIWQMDGLTGTIPFGKVPKEEKEDLQLSFFDLGFEDFGTSGSENDITNELEQECRVYDWRARKSCTFNSLKRSV